MNKKINQILFVGGNFDGKGLMILIQAAKMLDKNTQCKYIIVGNDKKLTDYIHIIKKYKLEEKFEFIKKIKNEDLKKYYGESQIFVLPSYVDSFPYSILEAMINKCAIISTRVGGIPEMIKKRSGILIEPGNSEELSNKILMLLNNSNMCKDYGLNAYKDSLLFKNDIMIDKHLSLYYKILQT